MYHSPVQYVSLAIPLLLAAGCSPKDRVLPGETGEDSLADSCTLPRADTDSGETGETTGGLGLLSGMDRMNVVVIHADTLRADHLPFYGYRRDTTPSLYELPRLLVRGYRAAAPWTLPSSATALLSRTPERHGRVSVSLPDEGAELTTMAERFADAGYATALMSGNQILASDEQLAQGFAERVEVPDLHDVESQTMAVLAATGEAWIEEVPEDQPFFIWFQPMDTHPPYRPQAPWRGTYADYDALPFSTDEGAVEQSTEFAAAWEAADTSEEREALVANVRAVYDELILQEDAAIGTFVEWLSKTGRLDRTLVVLTADHGETIGDDRTPTLSHMETLRPELVQLPLVFLHPDLPDEEVVCLSSNADLGPTLLRAVGLEPLPDVDGMPLQDTCRENAISSLYDYESAEMLLWELSVSDEDYKLDWNCKENSFALYDLRVDPGALTPVDMPSVEGSEAYWEALAEYLRIAQIEHPEIDCSTGL